jgi:hypothetical protein
MSYEIYAGEKNWHFTWNYNAKIIMPILGDEGLKQFNEKPCIEAAEGIAQIIETLNEDLRSCHSRAAMKRGVEGNGLADFTEKYGNGNYGHVTEGILRLTEIMIECYRNPTSIFIIH